MVLGITNLVRMPLAAVGRGLAAVDEHARAAAGEREDERAGGHGHHAGETVEELVEESVELVADALGQHRRMWRNGGDHVQIDVRGITRPQEQGLRDRLKRSLEQIDGVPWAEVNAVTGKVAVALHGGAPLPRVLGVIEGHRDRLRRPPGAARRAPAAHPVGPPRRRWPASGRRGCASSW